ncbi:YcgN family cysteine cluster protein [Marinobacter daepoensis]|uniref:YcgN family cysteine cluster protein n=1 Tax=Marinobacter daepoensis TaxID=262077 RepID=UPI001C94CBCC|nr:YcgN family cysteine cluster protein [Marinobacter daepoensis]MBY6032494.1 YcgN family cysteine cluster protein [Marinobacter daepoensis]
MIAQIPFWQRKRLAEMSPSEWESLCDGCGQCCLQKLEDEDTGEVYYTDLVCRYMETSTCGCSVYEQRLKKVPGCTVLTADTISQYHWLPYTCAYRTLAEGRALPDWHPLRSGDPETVHRSGVSVQGKVMSEDCVPEEDWEEHIIHWVL